MKYLLHSHMNRLDQNPGKSVIVTISKVALLLTVILVTMIVLAEPALKLLVAYWGLK